MPRFTAGAGCGTCSAHSSPALPTPQHGARKLQPTPQSSPNTENVLTLQYVPGLHAAWSHEHNALVTPETQPRQGGTQNGRRLCQLAVLQPSSCGPRRYPCSDPNCPPGLPTWGCSQAQQSRVWSCLRRSQGSRETFVGLVSHPLSHPRSDLGKRGSTAQEHAKARERLLVPKQASY